MRNLSVNVEPQGVENLLERQERMVAHAPVFCDITWGAGGTTAGVTLDIASKMQNQICVDTMMHLTCTNITVDTLESALNEAKKQGIQNILALRGDPPKGQEKFETVEGGFSCALDLVKFIREKFGDYFGIAVAGYPEAHPDTIVDDPEQMEKNYWDNIKYLKQKIEAGGQLIVTQLFYDVDIFFKFIKDCRSVGIDVPIIPGIMPIMTYGGFKRMTGFCKTKVPQELHDKVESLKDDEAGLKAFGIEHGAEMCKRILEGGVPGLHMYSLNLDAAVFGILEKLGMLNPGKPPKSLPWKCIPAGTRRASEAVRPICWANRHRSYIKRTAAADSFPTSSWGTSSSTMLGSLPSPESLRHHTASAGRRTKAAEAWGGSLETVSAVATLFTKFYAGELASLPWSESAFSGPAMLASKQSSLISSGMLPINGQLALNGIESTDEQAGWGGPGGRVYQKSYVEAFVSPDAYKAMLPKLQARSGITFAAANKAGTCKDCSASADSVSAVTWGVFPGREVVQPYVFDVTSFRSWAEEAFALWSAELAHAYEPGSATAKALEEIAGSYYLVAVLDEDFVAGDAFTALA